MLACGVARNRDAVSSWRGAVESSREERLARARRELGGLAWLLDSTFRIPGTRFRFGLEPIIGLIPAAGDVVSGALGFYLVARAIQFRLPWIVVARMVANTLLDLAFGAVPVLGDAFDFVYRSNARNMRLFEEYATDPARSTRREWIGFGVVAGALVALVLGLVLLADYVLSEIARLL